MLEGGLATVVVVLTKVSDVTVLVVGVMLDEVVVTVGSIVEMDGLLVGAGAYGFIHEILTYSALTSQYKAYSSCAVLTTVTQEGSAGSLLREILVVVVVIQFCPYHVVQPPLLISLHRRFGAETVS